MTVLRTPDERFSGLVDWPYQPCYSEVASHGGVPLRMAHIDEGPAGGRIALLMHGEPTWSYLYRGMIPALVERGYRAIAPDLIGFGRSDKLSDQADYTFERHVAWMSEWLVLLDLRNIVLFCQDWGGLIGLRLVAAFPDRFAGVVVSNTGLPTGEGATEGFQRWLEFSQTTPTLPISGIIQMGTSRTLSEAERAAYDAPFPDESFKAGARRFPALVPITSAHPSVAENKSAWERLQAFEKPFLTAFSDNDPVTRGGERLFQAMIPGAAGQAHRTLSGGHFIQEDSPLEAVSAISELMERT